MANQDTNKAREALQLLIDLCLPQEEETVSLPQDPDWTTFLAPARSHGLSPLLYHRMGQLRLWSQCPEEIKNALRYDFIYNLRRTELQRRELINITKALGEASIPVIPYKGCFLSQLIYGDPYVRVSVDIDIIIPKDSVKKAWDILTKGMGYKGLAPYKGFVDVSKTNEYHFVVAKRPSKEGGTFQQAEVHWGLLRSYAPFSPPMNRIWATATPVSMWDTTFHKPENTAHFLMLVVHCLCDTWPLKSMVDLANFHSSFPPHTLDALKEEASLWGVNPLLEEALSKMEALRAPRPLNEQEYHTRREYGLQVLKDMAGLTGTKRKKLRHFIHVLTMPGFRDYDLVPGTRKSRILATIVRPYRLFKEWFLK
jgi:hypothetical protein